MRFKPVTDSVCFEFEHMNFNISIADFVSNNPIRYPSGKISVLITKNGMDLSTKSLERLAKFIELRICGTISVSPNVMDIQPFEGDQFMQVLFDGLRTLFPM